MLTDAERMREKQRLAEEKKQKEEEDKIKGVASTTQSNGAQG